MEEETLNPEKMEESEAKIDLQTIQRGIDALGNAATPINETIEQDETLAEKLQKEPITDLKSAIGLNDKILFTNELFGGSAADYEQAIDHLNSLDSLQAANSYVQSYGWDDNEAVTTLKDLVERKFS